MGDPVSTFLSDLQDFVSGKTPQGVKIAIVDPNGKVTTVGGGELPPDEEPKKKATTKKKANTPSTTPNASELEQQIANSNLWNELGQSLVGTQQALEAPVIQSLSGGLTQSADSSATNQALSEIGFSPTSSAAKWLSSEQAQATKNDTPMQDAMNAYAAAYSQGQAGISTALGAMGQANQLAVQTAPEADWTQALAQHIMSNVNYYGEIAPAQAAGIPTALQYYLSQSGGGGAAAPGSFPITDTPSEWAQAIQAYYKSAPESTNNAVPNPSTAAPNALQGGTGGYIPSDTGAAPS